MIRTALIVLSCVVASAATSEPDIPKAVGEIDAVSNALAQTEAQYAQAQLAVQQLPARIDALKTELNKRTDALKADCEKIGKQIGFSNVASVGEMRLNHVDCIAGLSSH